jgi:hypothetical protein
MLGIDAAKPPEVDYCAWQPASAALVSRILAKEPDREVSYALNTTDGDSRSPASLNLEMKTHTGSRLGTLQCFFPRTASAAQIQFSRWVSIVGAHVSIETQR